MSFTIINRLNDYNICNYCYHISVHCHIPNKAQKVKDNKYEGYYNSEEINFKKNTGEVRHIFQL